MQLSFLRNFTYWLRVVSLGLIVGLSIQFVHAWTAPTGTPPAGNVGGPLTTGSVNQVKSASLGLTGNLVVGGQVQTSTLQVTSGAGAGNVLTSDATGNATWQTNAGAVLPGTPCGAVSTYGPGYPTFACQGKIPNQGCPGGYTYRALSGSNSDNWVYSCIKN